MRNPSLYNVNDIRRYIDNENFGLLLDTANAKYNGAIWKKYADWGTPSDDREWSQGQKETPIMVRASVLGTYSAKPQRNTEGWKVYGGSIPKLGHGFSIDEDDLFAIRKASKLTDTPYGDLMVDSLLQNSTNMIGGVHNELNYMLLQAMSTGQINDVALDGTKYDYRFPIAANRFQTVSTAWFNTSGVAVSSATVVEDILDLQDYYTNTLNLAVDHWKISKALLDKIVKHPAVIKACAARRNFYNLSDVVLTRQDVLTVLHENGVWPFDVIDHKSRHEENGVAVNDAPAFDEHNMVAASSAFKMFEMKCANSIMLDRQSMGGIAANHNYSFVEGRIAVLSSFEERPFKNVVDCELYAAPVFKNLNEIGISTVWSES